MESEQEYRLLFESNPQPMWVSDCDTLKFLAVNEAATRQYGYSREEFLSMTLLDFELEADVRRLPTAEQQRTPRLQRPERHKHKVKGGSLIDVETTSRNVFFGGRAAKLVLALDITERLRMEDQLCQSEEKFSKAFRSCPLAITITTLAEGRCLEVNDAFLRTFGHSRQDVIGRWAADLNIWAFPQDRETMAHELFRSGRLSGFETVFNTKSAGPRQVQLFAERIELGGMVCILAITHDVTESKRLDEQFRQSQKMEAVGRLAGGVAHDFNNMLGIILGYCDLTENHLMAGPTKKNIHHIRQAAERGANLTQRLLAFSRNRRVLPSVFNLNTVVKEINQMLYRVLPSNIQLRFQAGESLGDIKADLSQVEQVLVNLVVNARDAMPTGGEIVIETQNIDLDETHARKQPGVSPGAYVSLSISDTGCGMTQETMTRIFEPFYTTKPIGEGSGLGLNMVYGVIQEGGGHMIVASEVGVGTTLQLYFPRIEEFAAPRPVAYSAAMPIHGSETVLVVEDETPLRELIVRLLETDGYNVLECSDGQTAIALSKRHQSTIHVLIADLVLPGMSGREAAALLRESRPELKVLYISGYIGDLIPKQSSDAVAVLEKPFTKDMLLSELRHVLEPVPQSQ